mgnify:CR=1 FL=1
MILLLKFAFVVIHSSGSHKKSKMVFMKPEQLCDQFRYFFWLFYLPLGIFFLYTKTMFDQKLPTVYNTSRQLFNINSNIIYTI